MLKGYKTLAINAGVVAGGALLSYAAGIDWTQYVGPNTGMIILAAVNFGLRFFTTTPVGVAKP
jgi:ABC-type glucose/galactose transport system permease subunit